MVLKSLKGESGMAYFKTNETDTLFYKYYPSKTTACIVILLHGISEDHKYLAPLANYLANQEIATVYTPDLRGYGDHTQVRGDIHYIGQHEDDIAAFLSWMKESHPMSQIILAGHSAGGGTVLRFSNTAYKSLVDAYLLIAPMVHYKAPTVPVTYQPKLGIINRRKLVALQFCNLIGVDHFNNHIVYKNPKAKEKIHGSETLELSFRLFVSRYPTRYKKVINQLAKPTLVLVGNQDEVFCAEAYPSLFADNKNVATKMIAATDHDGILTKQQGLETVGNWIKSVMKDD